MFIEDLKPSTDKLTSRRKTPRSHLIKETDDLGSLRGVSTVWDDRSVTAVVDLSLTGLILEREGFLQAELAKSNSKVKVGQVLDLCLRVDGLEEKMPLKVRITRISENRVYTFLDAISSEGRLRMDQDLKDRIVRENLDLLSPRGLDLQFHNSYWFHGPFDTNLVVTAEFSGLLEYDGVLMKWDPNGYLCFKSNASSTDEHDSYSRQWMTPPPNKVSMGASWKDRALQLFSQVGPRSGLDTKSIEILKSTIERLRSFS